jgi:hypothetical protein
MKKVALLVGVEDYRDKMISRLSFARADALALADRLRQRCGFHDVRVLAGESGEDAPDMLGILNALQDLAGELRPEDLFLFFFAGHGVEMDGQGYLLVRDSSWAFPEQASLSLATLQKTFGRLAASKRVLVIDACRNSPDAAKGDAGNRMGDGLCRDIVAVARASARAGMTTALLSSCRSGQRAREWPAKGHGVFTHYLLDGLDGAAWKSGELELEDLAAYAAKEVRRWCASTPGIREPQDPWYEKFGDPEPILLAARVGRRPSSQLVQLVQVRWPMGRSEANQIQRAAAIGLRMPLEIALPCGTNCAIPCILVPPGWFEMGSPNEERERHENEGPPHRVMITRPFYLGKCAVTQEQYELIVGVNPSRVKGESHPVENVSWFDAIVFCQKLADSIGKSIRLPTEAEWEYACRSGTNAPFNTGWTITTDQANYNGRYWYGPGTAGVDRGGHVAVGSFSPNAWGLHDMHGNAWEWCADWYAPYSAEEQADPVGPETGVYKILRGGCYYFGPRYCRSADRRWLEPFRRSDSNGFRVVVVC